MSEIDLKDEKSSAGTGKAINTDLMSDVDKKLYDSKDAKGKAESNGLGTSQRVGHPYDTPKPVSRPGDAQIEGQGCLIRLQRDRKDNIYSGTGGTNQTHAAAIDLVAGQMGVYGKSHTKKNEEINVDPSFTHDAARVYISQKADIDDYLDITEGIRSTSIDSPKSAVALKADVVRIVGRENIKLITRTDAQNSQGGSLTGAYTGDYGIQLVAMNDDSDLQPMVKGGNLKDCLEEIIDNINDLRELFKNFVVEDRALTQALIKHTHRSPFYGQLTSPDFEGLMPDGIESMINKLTNVELQLNTQMQKMNSVQLNYLETPGGSEAADGCKGKFILSKYNITN